jgi:cysteine desulfurase
MGLAEQLCGTNIRMSMGWGTTREDVDHFIEAWIALYNRHNAS